LHSGHDARELDREVVGHSKEPYCSAGKHAADYDAAEIHQRPVVEMGAAHRGSIAAKRISVAMPDGESQQVRSAPVLDCEAEQALRDEGHDQRSDTVPAHRKRNADQAVTEHITCDAGQLNGLEIEVP